MATQNTASHGGGDGNNENEPHQSAIDRLRVRTMSAKDQARERIKKRKAPKIELVEDWYMKYNIDWPTLAGYLKAPNKFPNLDYKHQIVSFLPCCPCHRTV